MWKKTIADFWTKSGIFGVFLPFWLIFDNFWQNGSVFANQCERRELLIFWQSRVFLAFFSNFGWFLMIFGKMDQCLLSIVKEDNPWDVSSLYDFNYYCCPECDSKSQNKQDFINHASNNHPWVSKCCLLGIVEKYFWS